MLCKKLIVIVGILFLGGVARVSAQEDSVRLSKELVRKMQNMPNIEVGKGITFEPKNKLYKMTLRFRMQNMLAFELDDRFSLNNTEAQVKRLRLRFDGYILTENLLYSDREPPLLDTAGLHAL